MRWKFRLRSYNGTYRTAKLYTEQKSVRGALDWRVGQWALFNNSSNSDIPFHLPRASLLMEQRQLCIIRQQSPSLNKLHISQIFRAREVIIRGNVQCGQDGRAPVHYNINTQDTFHSTLKTSSNENARALGPKGWSYSVWKSTSEVENAQCDGATMTVQSHAMVVDLYDL